MFILYFGGQKSGKSRLAESKALELAKNKKPYYIATYDNSYGDLEMQNRVKKHQEQREEKFISIEECFNLAKNIKEDETYIIDCMSMWLLNGLEKTEDELLSELDKLSKCAANIVFVLNDVSCGIIPLEKLSRKYVDLSGIIGQRLASICNEVYEVKLGLTQRLK